ncbi:MAG: hypothetical protein Q8M83_00340 [bacterium]|nr:hypothetical protein [bacterium]
MSNKPKNNQVPTENDLKNLATKSDLNKVIKKSEKILKGEILRVEERVERVEERLGNKIDGIEAKLDKIAVTLDGFIGRVDDLTTENEVGTNQIHQLQEDVKDHDLPAIALQ